MYYLVLPSLLPSAVPLQVGLLSMHTLWFREHNRIVTELRDLGRKRTDGSSNATALAGIFPIQLFLSSLTPGCISYVMIHH